MEKNDTWVYSLFSSLKIIDDDKKEEDKKKNKFKIIKKNDLLRCIKSKFDNLLSPIYLTSKDKKWRNKRNKICNFYKIDDGTSDTLIVLEKTDEYIYCDNLSRISQFGNNEIDQYKYVRIYIDEIFHLEKIRIWKKKKNKI